MRMLLEFLSYPKNVGWQKLNKIPNEKEKKNEINKKKNEIASIAEVQV